MPDGRDIQSVQVWVTRNKAKNFGPFKSSAMVSELKRMIADQEAVQIEYISLKHMARNMQDGETLGSHNVVTNSLIFMSYRFNGGATMKVSKEEECPICMEDNDGSVLICDMPCGHPICSGCMQECVMNAVKKPNFGGIICNQCRGPLDLGLCIQVAMLTDQELTQVSMALGKNDKTDHTHVCPGCEGQMQIGDDSGNRILCPRKDCQKLWCKRCGRDYGSESHPFVAGQTWCGNMTCDSEPTAATADQAQSRLATTLRALLNTPQMKYKTIGSTPNCPDTRLCPNCDSVVEHIEYCLHMKCYSESCQQNQAKWSREGNSGNVNQFCFICLAKPVETPIAGDRKSANLHPSYTCTPAPIQSI